MCCLPLCRSAGTGAGDMLFGHWFPPHVAMSMVPVTAHGDVERCRCILLQMNMEITSDNVIDLYLFVFSYLYIHVLYISVFCL